MKITAKEVRAAAASVRGARSMGIETAASKAAPDLLARAEAALAAMFSRAAGMEPSAPDQASEAAYGAAFAKADAIESAIAELRNALGVLTPATPAAPAAPAVEHAPAVKQDADAAAAEKLRLQQWDAAAQESPVMFAADGQRLALVQTRAVRYGESRFSSLGGWDAGGEVIAEAQYELQTRSGRSVQRGERYVVIRSGEEGVEAVDYVDGRPAGAFGMTERFSATSEWLPENAAEPLSMCGFIRNPRYASEWECAQVWRDAQAARRAERAAAREAKALPDEQEKSWTLADLQALSKRGRR